MATKKILTDLHIDGNVGIGTTTPSERLSVAGGIYAETYRVASSISDVGVKSLLTLNTTVNTGIKLNAGITANYNAYIQGYNSQDISSRALVLNPFGGNVGIGTTNPGEKLEVEGNIKLSSIGTGNSANSYGMLFYGTTSSGTQTDQAKIHSSAWVTNSNGGNLQLYTSNASNVITERMRIDGAGNVGIGTTSPGAKLEVSSADNIAAILNSSSTFTFLDFEKNGANRVQIGNASDGDFIIRTSDAERMRIDSVGNIGIGLNPSEKLEVNGNILATGTVLGSNLSGTNTGDQDLSGYLTSSSTQSKYLRSDADDSMSGILTIDNDFIVTNSTDYLLHVDSSAYKVTIGDIDAASYGNYYEINGNTGNSTWITNGTTQMTLSSVGVLDVASNVQASSFIKDGGTSSQFLKADGSVDSNTYVSAGNYRKYYEIRYLEHIALSDETTALTTGTSKVTFRAPESIVVTGFRITCGTAPSGSVITVDVNVGGTSILPTKLTIDAGEKTSYTAATAMQFSGTSHSIANDAEITVDIDGVGSSAAGAGLKLIMYYTIQVIIQ